MRPVLLLITATAIAVHGFALVNHRLIARRPPSTTQIDATYLSHAMLQVANVNATVDYWTREKGARLHTYRRTNTTESAFVGYGVDSLDRSHFSLELVRNKAPVELGNAIVYIGLSMLLAYDFTSRRDIAKLVEQNQPSPPMFQPQPTPPLAIETDPNGLVVKSVASAPGDFLARLALRAAAPLQEVADFYTAILGMEQAACDDTMLCLRGPVEEGQRLPLTLIFIDDDDEELVFGNCFDHLVIGVDDLSAVEALVAASHPSALFLTPRPMFGAQVMGVQDPSGYRIIVMERPGDFA